MNAPPQFLIKHLNDAGIQTALIIDDAFDNLTAAELVDELQVFWDPILRKENGADVEFAGFCDLASERLGTAIDVSSPDEFTDELIRVLYQEMHEFPKIRELACASVFATKIEKLEPLIELKRHLTGLGIVSRDFPSDADLSTETAHLIFLDYFLGETNQAAAIENSQVRIRDIFANVAVDQAKPFVVLMSSEEIDEAMQKTFCEAADLLHGLLTFSPKRNLEAEQKLFFDLATWAVDLPQRHTIQHFTESLQNSLKNAQDQFGKFIRGLGVEDYANIQWLSLQEEGHPLGDYLIWLFKELLGHIVHDDEKVLAALKQLDSIKVDRFIPSTTPPSSSLAELYRYALMEPGVGHVENHPQEDGDSNDPLFGLGDIFLKEDCAKVLIVLTAACDLALSPLGKRQIDPEKHILFGVGKLQPILEKAPNTSMRTEPFLHPNGKVYRINWSHKQAIWKEYKLTTAWLDKHKFERKFRLSLPYALELQRSFANHIARIGLPIHPPRSTWIETTICCEKADGTWHSLATIENGAQLIHRRVDEQLQTLVVFNKLCISQLSDSTLEAVKQLETQKENFNGELGKMDATNEKQREILGKKILAVDNKIKKINELDCSLENCVHLVSCPIEVTLSEKEWKLGDKLPVVLNNVTPNGRYRSETPLSILVNSKEA